MARKNVNQYWNNPDDEKFKSIKAVADFIDPDTDDIDYAAFLDAVEPILADMFKLETQSGRSDEYYGFGNQVADTLGSVDWYVKIEDSSVYNSETTGLDSVDIDVTIVANIMAPSKKNIINAESGTVLNEQQPTSITYIANGRALENVDLDDDTTLSSLTAVEYQFYGVGAGFSFSTPDEFYTPSAFAKSVYDEVETIKNEALGVKTALYELLNEE